MQAIDILYQHLFLDHFIVWILIRSEYLKCSSVDKINIVWEYVGVGWGNMGVMYPRKRRLRWYIMSFLKVSWASFHE